MTMSNESMAGLFPDTRAVLQFAFSIHERPLVQRQRFGDIAALTPAQDAMTPHDWHGQGSWIIRDIGEVLPPMQAMVVYAYYGSGALRERAIENVAILLSGLHSNEKLVGLLTRRYFHLGQKKRETLRAIAAETGVKRWKVEDIDAKVFRKLTAAMEQCESRLSDHFIEKGLIPRQ